MRARTSAKRFDAALEGRSGRRRAGAPMSAAAPSASICRSNVQLPNDFFAQAVIVAKDVAGARAAAGEAGEAAGRRIPEAWSRVSIRWSLGRRSAGRCSIASAAPTLRRCAKSRFELGADRSPRNPQAEQGQFRLDRAGAASAHPHRPGRGAAAGPELAGAGDASSTP